MDRFDRILYEDLSLETTWTRLGKGSFGSVFKGDYLGIEVAIKEVMASVEYDMAKYFARECQVMEQARHPNIVQYLGLCAAPPAPGTSAVPQTRRILIISEFLPRGNLREYIYDKQLLFPWRLRMSFAIDVTRGLAYLHSRNCLHRDLKGENLLVSENERLKLCDFGFSRLAPKTEEDTRRLTYCGTDGYMSPEIIMGEEFSLPTDIFSLGVIFVELLSRVLVDSSHFQRSPPSFGLDLDEIRSSASPHCPPSFLALALACIAVEPSQRPTAINILKALRLIEQEVLEMESRGVGVDLENDHERRGTWNVGSVSFSGTMKKGSTARKGKKEKESSSRRIPDFEGKPQSPSIIRKKKQGGDGESSSDDSDLDVAELALAEVKVDHARREGGGGESQVGLLLKEEKGETYSTGVIKRPARGAASTIIGGHSTITLKGFQVEEALGATHERLSSSNSISSLPSLPPSWIHPRTDGKSDDEADEADEADEIQANATTQADLLRAESFMTAHSDTVSIAAATIDHHDPDEVEEENDTFHSTLNVLHPDSDPSNTPIWPLHRFSLIKPSLQRFIVGNLPSVVKSHGIGGIVSGKSGLEIKRNATEGVGNVGLGIAKRSVLEENGNGFFSSVGNGRCGLCEKRLGMLKAHLRCDDCGFICHLKCSDACPPRCGEALFTPEPLFPSVPRPTRAPPATPTADKSSPSQSLSASGPSKLLKKRPVSQQGKGKSSVTQPA